MTTEIEFEEINRFTGIYHFLSNFYLIKVEYDGVLYRSVEHGFQAAKTLIPEERTRIKDASTPGLAKKLGRQCTKRPNWESIRVDVMGELLRHKFGYPVMKALLLKTGNIPLVEGNTWHDQYWGNCTCPFHISKDGENMLGKLLMKIRSELSGG